MSWLAPNETGNLVRHTCSFFYGSGWGISACLYFSYCWWNLLCPLYGIVFIVYVDIHLTGPSLQANRFLKHADCSIFRSYFYRSFSSSHLYRVVGVRGEGWAEVISNPNQFKISIKGLRWFGLKFAFQCIVWWDSSVQNLHCQSTRGYWPIQTSTCTFCKIPWDGCLWLL